MYILYSPVGRSAHYRWFALLSTFTVTLDLLGLYRFPEGSGKSDVGCLVLIEYIYPASFKIRYSIFMFYKHNSLTRCRNKERDPSEKCFPVFVIATEDGVYIEADDADG